MVIIEMNRKGDERSTFDVADPVALAEAEKLFADFIGKGRMAVVPGANGAPGRQIKSFDATAETVVIYPHLVGG